jgi:S-adenosylmethionine:tRNA ribosyltransferase-isomerase
MNKQDFYFDLPEPLIAQHPLTHRVDSRLLSYSRQNQHIIHQNFKDLPSLLEEGDLLVLNNSKVIPARFFGQKETGGKVEFLIERMQDGERFIAHIRASKALKSGMRVFLEKGWVIRILEKRDDLYHCQVEGPNEVSNLTTHNLSLLETMLEDIGHVPLPLYINREDEVVDKSRYQTVYALYKGSVAAPTAGLHFDENLLQQLEDKGIQHAFVTLHVGAGTFRPVRTDSLHDHVMHSEQCIVSQELCDAVNETHARKKRVIAVGTTAMRSLETAAKEGMLQAYHGDTNIFIYPGYQFKICDGLLTNFHLPESTLLMLVSAFVGHSQTMALYQEAIAKRYRFYSYGDACLFL